MKPLNGVARSSERGQLTIEAVAMACDRPPLYQYAVSRRQFLALLGLVTGAGVARGSGAAPAIVPRENERSLRLYNTHTSERLQIVYWEPEGYIKEALADISYLLRDHHTGAVHPIDPGLLDLLHDLNAVLDTVVPFHVLSGFRSPATNARLVARQGAARHSLHMEGKAIDIRMPGRSLNAVRRAALALKSGGVGYHPRLDFVHIDVGPVRYWERSRARRTYRSAPPKRRKLRGPRR